MKTPEEYLAEGHEWMMKAERIAEEYEGKETFDTSANLAVLAMANALLAICARLIQEQEDD
jgi:hypothetical protein